MSISGAPNTSESLSDICADNMTPVRHIRDQHIPDLEEMAVRKS